MKPWRRAWYDGNEAGAVASLLSAAVLALGSRREAGSPYACLNATSHWIWGDGAAGHQGPSVRYTGAGYLIHHAASCFWGVLYERSIGERADEWPAAGRIAAGLTAAAVASVVDFRVVPHRLSPGFELRLSRPAITAGYVAFGFGLALAGIVRTARKERSAQSSPCANAAR
ncbi:MAG TPA: hypothetical protein VEY69_05290 [Lautropia sp.]|nr:hypothetical protein [Lautropia sp.]